MQTKAKCRATGERRSWRLADLPSDLLALGLLGALCAFSVSVQPHLSGAREGVSNAQGSQLQVLVPCSSGQITRKLGRNLPLFGHSSQLHKCTTGQLRNRPPARLSVRVSATVSVGLLCEVSRVARRSEGQRARGQSSGDCVRQWRRMGARNASRVPLVLARTTVSGNIAYCLHCILSSMQGVRFLYGADCLLDCVPQASGHKHLEAQKMIHFSGKTLANCSPLLVAYCLLPFVRLWTFGCHAMPARQNALPNRIHFAPLCTGISLERPNSPNCELRPLAAANLLL